eukprot:5686811-Pyramimonas_sp.AAC.1
MGRFWRSPGNFGIQRSMVKGLFVNAALSGLEVRVKGHLPLTCGDLASLEGFIARKCRAIRGGAASGDEGLQHAICGLDALNNFLLAPPFTKLHTWRLKRLQNMAQGRGQH